MGHTNIASRVTLLREFTSKEFVEFGAEDTVSYELALFADLSRHLEDGKCLQRRIDKTLVIIRVIEPSSIAESSLLPSFCNSVQKFFQWTLRLQEFGTNLDEM